MEEIPLIKQIRNDLGTYDNFKKIEIDWGDDHTTDC